MSGKITLLRSPNLYSLLIIPYEYAQPLAMHVCQLPPCKMPLLLFLLCKFLLSFMDHLLAKCFCLFGWMVLFFKFSKGQRFLDSQRSVSGWAK